MVTFHNESTGLNTVHYFEEKKGNNTDLFLCNKKYKNKKKIELPS